MVCVVGVERNQSCLTAVIVVERNGEREGETSVANRIGAGVEGAETVGELMGRRVAVAAAVGVFSVGVVLANHLFHVIHHDGRNQSAEVVGEFAVQTHDVSFHLDQTACADGLRSAWRIHFVDFIDGNRVGRAGQFDGWVAQQNEVGKVRRNARAVGFQVIGFGEG